MLLNGIFSYWPCYRSEGSLICLGIVVLARCEVRGQYIHPKVNMTGKGPVTGPMLNCPFHDKINQFFFFFFNFKVLKVNKTSLSIFILVACFTIQLISDLAVSDW